MFYFLLNYDIAYKHGVERFFSFFFNSLMVTTTRQPKTVCVCMCMCQ